MRGKTNKQNKSLEGVMDDIESYLRDGDETGSVCIADGEDDSTDEDVEVNIIRDEHESEEERDKGKDENYLNDSEKVVAEDKEEATEPMSIHKRECDPVDTDDFVTQSESVGRGSADENDVSTAEVDEQEHASTTKEELVAEKDEEPTVASSDIDEDDSKSIELAKPATEYKEQEASSIYTNKSDTERASADESDEVSKQTRELTPEDSGEVEELPIGKTASFDQVCTDADEADIEDSVNEIPKEVEAKHWKEEYIVVEESKDIEVLESGQSEPEELTEDKSPFEKTAKEIENKGTKDHEVETQAGTLEGSENLSTGSLGIDIVEPNESGVPEEEHAAEATENLEAPNVCDNEVLPLFASSGSSFNLKDTQVEEETSTKQPVSVDDVTNDIDDLLNEFEFIDDSEAAKLLSELEGQHSTKNRMVDLKHVEQDPKQDKPDSSQQVSHTELRLLLEKEPVYIYTSLAGGGYHMPSRTNRLAQILTVNKVEFSYRDLGTDTEARNVWKRYSRGKSLPGVVRGKDDIIGNWEEIDEANEEYKVRELIYETL